MRSLHSVGERRAEQPHQAGVVRARQGDPRNSIAEPKLKPKITYDQLFGKGFKDMREYNLIYQLYDILSRKDTMNGMGTGRGFGGISSISTDFGNRPVPGLGLPGGIDEPLQMEPEIFQTPHKL